MNFPQIGDKVSTQQALELCEFFKLDYLVERIQADPGAYNEWVFDGCSCVPDELMGLFTGCDWKDITYKCCLPHDLAYGYGEPDNDVERERVDIKFYSDLITKAGMKKWLASAFVTAARVGGFQELGASFSWAFARKDKQGADVV